MSKGSQAGSFVVVGFVETPGPIRLLQKNTFSRNAVSSRRQARFTPLDPLGSPLGVIGSPLGPLGSPLFLLTLSHFRYIWLPGSLFGRLGSSLVSSDFLCVPLGSPWVSACVPLATQMSLLLNVFDVFF